MGWWTLAQVHCWVAPQATSSTQDLRPGCRFCIGEARKLRMRCGALIAVVVSCVLMPRPASAIPVFARIYDKPCSACHTVYPQLNPAGEDFRAHGLHGLRPAIAPRPLGAHLDVPGTLPLALSFAAGEDVTRTDAPGQPSATHSRTNFNVLALLAGGELGPHLAFLADYGAAHHERGDRRHHAEQPPGSRLPPGPCRGGLVAAERPRRPVRAAVRQSRRACTGSRCRAT